MSPFFRNKRLREGALSALSTPKNPPAPPSLVPLAQPQDEPESPRRQEGVSPKEATARPRAGLSAEPDAALVQTAVTRAKEGDAEGLHYLYVRYAPDVQRYVASIVHDSHEAEDITQNVFAKLMKTIGKYEQREVPFTAWILRVARNATLDHMRARRAVPAEEMRIDADQTEIRSHALRDALEQLPEDQREVLVLRHIVGLSPVEIATTLDKTESSVHGLHHRGRRTLIQTVLELGNPPVKVPPAPY